MPTDEVTSALTLILRGTRTADSLEPDAGIQNAESL